MLILASSFLIPLISFIIIFGYFISIKDKIDFGVPKKEDRKDLNFELSKVFKKYIWIYIIFMLIMGVFIFFNIYLTNFIFLIGLITLFAINFLINLIFFNKLNNIHKSSNFFYKNE